MFPYDIITYALIPLSVAVITDRRQEAGSRGNRETRGQGEERDVLRRA